MFLKRQSPRWVLTINCCIGYPPPSATNGSTDNLQGDHVLACTVGGKKTVQPPKGRICHSSAILFAVFLSQLFFMAIMDTIIIYIYHIILLIIIKLNNNNYYYYYYNNNNNGIHIYIVYHNYYIIPYINIYIHHYILEITPCTLYLDIPWLMIRSPPRSPQPQEAVTSRAKAGMAMGWPWDGITDHHGLHFFSIEMFPPRWSNHMKCGIWKSHKGWAGHFIFFHLFSMVMDFPLLW